jgi:FixJ family two-component response regulator
MPWNATAKDGSRDICKGEVFVIDDDAATRETLTKTLRKEGYVVISFASGSALLSYARLRKPVCVFVEVGLSDRSGFDVLRKLRAENCPAPIFATSTDGVIPMAVDAIRNGAFDFIVKPVCVSDIVARMDAALDEYARAATADDVTDVPLYLAGCEPLNNRERQVLARLAIGETNKGIARHLGLSARTVEGYRAAIMRKFGVRNATELLRRVFSQDPQANRPT